VDVAGQFAQAAPGHIPKLPQPLRQLLAHPPDPRVGGDPACSGCQSDVADCDAKIARFRATLDAGGDPTLVAGWISETTVIKKAAQAPLGFTEAPPERMSEERIAAIVQALGGLLGLLRQANPARPRRDLQPIGPQMRYRPGTGTVLAEI
jgi:hypothetical protein